MSLPGWVRLFPIAAVLAGLAAAGAWSIRVGWADYRIRQNTIAATEQAIALIPDNADYSARLAVLMSEGDPRKSKDAFRRAVSLNPWNARSWIDLGLRAEQEGDNATAKMCLLRAAGADREFLPRWTLANYYFRHDDAERFWFWAKEAVAMVSGDAQPVFRLCGRVEEDGELIDRLEIRNPEVRAGYLSYLLGQKRVDLIGRAAHRLIEDNRETDVPLLLTACDRFLEAARVDEAVDLWDRLAEAGRLPFATPAAKGLELLANGRFTTPPTSKGFDWRLAGAEGISVSREGADRGLRITFSGSEPEECEALVQLVPVRGKTQYELRYEYRTQEIAIGAGIGWRIASAGDGAPLGEGPSLASEADSEQQLFFETPAECRLVRLALRYRRAPGTTRMDGFLVLQKVSLEPAIQAPAEGARVRK
jgi:tetratricopeptide (TPR) repeat protein